MNNKETEEYLLRHEVKPTAVRIIVWGLVSTRQSPFTLKDVEHWLPYMDRSSIFRALRLFASRQLLHEIDDGSGLCKYCVCTCSAVGHVGHVHFTCTKCGSTFCLSDTQIPSVLLPQGFEMQEAEYIVKGVCNKCQLHASHKIGHLTGTGDTGTGDTGTGDRSASRSRASLHREDD